MMLVKNYDFVKKKNIKEINYDNAKERKK